jgi:hypothetical protein
MVRPEWIPGSSCGRPRMTAREKVTHADHLLALRLPVKLV